DHHFCPIAEMAAYIIKRRTTAILQNIEHILSLLFYGIFYLFYCMNCFFTFKIPEHFFKRSHQIKHGYIFLGLPAGLLLDLMSFLMPSIMLLLRLFGETCHLTRHVVLAFISQHAFYQFVTRIMLIESIIGLSLR